jgi:pyruvate, water dikinase
MNRKKFISNNIKVLEDCNYLEVGSKIGNIKLISEKIGCCVPKTLVINTEIFNQLLIENKIHDPLNYDWSKFQIPIEYQKIILKKIKQEFNNKALVIRSSATCEDSPLLSFAGQYSSFLNIKGKEKVLKAIKLCYQSLFSDNAKIYAKINGIRLENEGMAIAIQELIPVTIAGVIFTADPINKNCKKMIVEYTMGLGDSIMSGHKKPIRKEIEKIKANKLKPLFLKKLVKIALDIEDLFGTPQDIEWGWNGHQIYIFQSRSITTLNKRPKITNYVFNRHKIIGRGTPVCKGIGEGFLRIINNSQDYDKIKKGEVVLIKCKTDISLIKKIQLINALIVRGGVLSHIAVIAREFNVPCLTETIIIAKKLEKCVGKKIIVDAIKGKILLK